MQKLLNISCRSRGSKIYQKNKEIIQGEVKILTNEQKQSPSRQGRKVNPSMENKVREKAVIQKKTNKHISRPMRKPHLQIMHAAK